MGKFESSLNDGKHKLLSALSGDWEGTASTWFEPGDPVDQSPIAGSIRPVLEGRFALHEYTGSFQGKPLSGITIYGYDLKLNQWQSVLIDSFHMSTGIMFLQGGESEQMSFNGTYETGGEGSQQWGWKIEITMESPDQLLITSYNIEPGGEPTRAVEINYKRRN